MQLARSDAEAILRFLDEADRIDGVESYPAELLGLLGRLVPCDQVFFQDADVGQRRFIDEVPTAPDPDDDLYWTVGPCPIAEYRTRTGDLSAVRMSDVIGRSRYRELPIYREYFLRERFEHFLDLGLWGSRERYRSIVLVRRREGADFSDRDRDVVEALRPHLRAREARVNLRRALAEQVDPGRVKESGRLHARAGGVTTREREILRLVAEGRTNAEIAAQLWVSPATVKKHLENVYVKLDVTGRAAAAAVVQGRG